MERHLRPEDWEHAALSAIADGGVAALHIDELAAALGVTKGSFYWHFASRDVLLEASLTRWRDEALACLTGLSRIEAVHERLRALALMSIREEQMGRVEIALASVVDDEAVTRFIEAVVRYRMELLEAAFRTLRARDPARSALLANALFVGYLHTARVDPVRRPRSAGPLLRAWMTLLSAT